MSHRFHWLLAFVPIGCPCHPEPGDEPLPEPVTGAEVAAHLSAAADDPLPFLLGEVPGWADLHVHQFARTAFQGLVWGSLELDDYACDGPDLHAPGAEDSDPSCPCPGHGHGLDPLDGIAAAFVSRPGTAAHAAVPHSALSHWTGWRRWTHQQHHTLQRAHDGGLSLIVMSAVSNPVLCAHALGDTRDCSDRTLLRRQIAEAWAFEQTHDWYRIVLTPGQANHAQAAGKLAVVLSLEGSDWFSTRGQLLSESDASVRAALDHMENELGVRVVQPVHQWNTPIAGAALHEYPMLQLAAWDAGAALPGSIDPPLGDLLWEVACMASPSSCGLGEEDHATWPVAAELYRGYYRNRIGLTDLGRTLVDELTARGMLLDVSHLSEKASADVLDYLDPHVPVIHSHARYRDSVVLPTDTVPFETEYTASGDLIAAIAERGGVVGVRPSSEVTRTQPMPGGAEVDNTCSGSTRSLAQSFLWGAAVGVDQAFGSDMNGGAVQTRARGADQPEHDGWFCSAGQDDDDGAAEWADETPVPEPADPVRTAQFDRDGLGSMGLEPAMVEDLGWVGLPLAGVWSSGDAFVSAWARVRSVGPALPPSARAAAGVARFAPDPLADGVRARRDEREIDGGAR